MVIISKLSPNFVGRSYFVLPGTKEMYKGYDYESLYVDCIAIFPSRKRAEHFIDNSSHANL